MKDLLLKLCAIILLAIGIVGQEIGYYYFLRWALFIISGYFAYNRYEESRDSEDVQAIIFIIICFIFNPFIVFELGEELWLFVDWIVLIFIAASLLGTIIRNKEYLSIIKNRILLIYNGLAKPIFNKNYPNTPIKDNKANILFKSGKEHDKKREYLAAIVTYTLAISNDPKFSDAYYERGNTFFRIRGRDEEAINNYTEAIKLNPNKSEYYDARGWAIYSNVFVKYMTPIGKSEIDRSKGQALSSIPDDLSRAIDDFTMAIKLNPNMAEYYYNRYQAYGLIALNDLAGNVNRGYKEKSDRDMLMASKLDPTNLLYKQK